MKKKSKLKQVLTLLIIIGLWYYWYTKLFTKTSTTTTKIVETKVSTWSIENAIKVTWTSELVNEQTMKFNQTGKVAKINYKEWAQVKKWAVIASLNSDDVSNDIKQQQISLNDAEVKLAQTIKWPEDKDILNANNSVTTTESKLVTLNNDIDDINRSKESKIKDYENQITSKENDIKSNQNDITNKELQLTNSKNELATLLKTEDKGLSDYDVDLTKIIDTAYTDAKKQIIDWDNLLYSADEILWITDENKSKNDSYESVLAAKNSWLKAKAETDWRNSRNLMDIAKTSFNNISVSSKNSTNMSAALSNLSNAFDSMIILGKEWSDALNASIASTSLPQTDIDKYSSTFSSITSSSQSNLNSIKTTITNIEKLTDPELKKSASTNSINSKKQSIIDAEFAINKLKIDTAVKYQNDLDKLKSDLEYSNKDFEAQIKSKQIEIDNTNNTLTYNKESLRILLEWATKEEIILAKNSIAKQKISLENSKLNLDKFQLEAPFDGKLRKIDFKVWDNITSDDTKYIYIENPNLLQIKVTVDQLDVVKIKTWQDVKIVFDSFSDKTFDWKVSLVDSTPSSTSWVTSYTITITMDKWENKIYSWMTAKISIIVDSNKNALIVPSAFITTEDDKSYVVVKSWTTETKTEVVIWIDNSTNTEILSWINEWDIVLRKITISGSSSSTTSLFWSPWTRRSSSSTSSSSTKSSSSSSSSSSDWWAWWPPPGM